MPVWLQGGYTNGIKKILATMRWPIEKTADIAAGGQVFSSPGKLVK
jgi:hypothetical protein